MKRMEADDANAIHSFGCYYYNEELGFPQSYDKALELWHRAGELGCDDNRIIISGILTSLARCGKGCKEGKAFSRAGNYWGR